MRFSDNFSVLFIITWFVINLLLLLFLIKKLNMDLKDEKVKELIKIPIFKITSILMVCFCICCYIFYISLTR